MPYIYSEWAQYEPILAGFISRAVLFLADSEEARASHVISQSLLVQSSWALDIYTDDERHRLGTSQVRLSRLLYNAGIAGHYFDELVTFHTILGLLPPALNYRYSHQHWRNNRFPFCTKYQSIKKKSTIIWRGQISAFRQPSWRVQP